MDNLAGPRPLGILFDSMWCRAKTRFDIILEVLDRLMILACRLAGFLCGLLDAIQRL
jgi:hypothetical protein